MKAEPSSLQPDQKRIAPSPPSGRWEVAIVAGLLLLYVFMAVSATTRESTTFDEICNVTTGYLYWTQPSDQLQAENGILAQAWAAVPLLGEHLKPAPETGEPWGSLDAYGKYYRFFYSLGNDPTAMLFQARAMISLLAAALGALVYLWSRELFGTAGAMVSLWLFVFCPNILAHGALVTADMAAALGFCAATFSFWKLSHAVSWGNLLFSVAALCFLVLAKMSAILILPIFILILTVRFLSGRPVEIRLFAHQVLGGAYARVGIWSLLLGLHGLAVVGALWLAYDFTYYSWNQEAARTAVLQSPDFSLWSGPGLKAFVLEKLNESDLLPPAYLEGLSYTVQESAFRSAFVDGVYSTKGWWWFFPFAFLIKTPVASLLSFGLSWSALVLWIRFDRRGVNTNAEVPRCPDLYALSPLLILGGFYALVCLSTHLDIGLRHLLPIYPVLFILAGANAFWLLGGKPVFKMAVAALLLGTMTESLAVRPHYLAFFNQLVGGPRQGYRYLVDSSLDWGQDLPGLRDWLDKNVPASSGTRVYLSYFGTGDPKFFGVNAQLLPCFFDVSPPQNFPLQGGVYCLSATMLQGVATSFHPPWTPANETMYAQAQAELDRWNSTANDPWSRKRLLQEKGAAYWAACVKVNGDLRLARLCAYLRHRTPDDEVGYSILIYRLTDQDVRSALGSVEGL